MRTKTVEYRRAVGSIAGAQARELDFDKPANNDWLAVNQFTVSPCRCSNHTVQQHGALRGFADAYRELDVCAYRYMLFSASPYAPCRSGSKAVARPRAPRVRYF